MYFVTSIEPLQFSVVEHARVGVLHAGNFALHLVTATCLVQFSHCRKVCVCPRGRPFHPFLLAFWALDCRRPLNIFASIRAIVSLDVVSRIAVISELKSVVLSIVVAITPACSFEAAGFFASRNVTYPVTFWIASPVDSAVV